MQKTLTIRGKRFTGMKVARLFDKNEMTNGGDYIIKLNGDKYYANYRQVQDLTFAPTCNKDDANAIALMPDDGLFKWQIWLEYDPAKDNSTSNAAAALGSIPSKAKAKAAKINGAMGGRPRKVTNAK